VHLLLPITGAVLRAAANCRQCRRRLAKGSPTGQVRRGDPLGRRSMPGPHLKTHALY